MVMGLDEKTPNDIQGYEKRIRELEKRIAELEKAGETQQKPPEREPQTQGSAAGAGGIVEGVLGQFIPGLGGLIKALESSSPEFKQRIAETDAEIKHRIDVGWSSKPVVDYHISTRPLSRRPGRAAPPRTPEFKVKAADVPAREPVVDIIEENEFVSVIADLPGVEEKDLEVALRGTDLEIHAGGFSKKVALPGSPGSIVERSFKNGILQLKIDKARSEKRS
jgi:hypothetical protein